MHMVRGKWWEGSSTESIQISMLDKGIYSCYPNKSKNNQQRITLPGCGSFVGRFNLSHLQEDDYGFWRKKRAKRRQYVSRGIVMFRDYKVWCFSSTEFQERKMPGDTAMDMQPGGLGPEIWLHHTKDMLILYQRQMKAIKHKSQVQICGKTSHWGWSIAVKILAGQVQMKPLTC